MASCVLSWVARQECRRQQVHASVFSGASSLLYVPLLSLPCLWGMINLYWFCFRPLTWMIPPPEIPRKWVGCLVYLSLSSGMVSCSSPVLSSPSISHFSMNSFQWYQKVQRQQDSDRISMYPEVLSVGHSYGISQQDLLSLSKSKELNYFELLLIVSLVWEQAKISLTLGPSSKDFHRVHNFSEGVIVTWSGGQKYEWGQRKLDLFMEDKSMSKSVTPGSVCCLLAATGRERLVLSCPGFYIPLFVPTEWGTGLMFLLCFLPHSLFFTVTWMKIQRQLKVRGKHWVELWRGWSVLFCSPGRSKWSFHSLRWEIFH